MTTPPGDMVTSVYGIDVDWAAVRSAGDLPFEGAPCAECSLPLQNIIGQLGQDPYQAGSFALHFLAFVAATALAAFSYWRVPPSQKRNFFGLRVALVFFAVSRFFAWLYLAIATSLPVEREYIAFYVVPVAFRYASDITVFWTIVRTTLQPMVAASQYRRAKGVGLGLTIPLGLAATADWILQCWQTGTFLTQPLADIVYFTNGVMPGNFIASITWGGLGIIWGIVVFALAIRATREARPLAAPFRLVPKAMIAASLIWTLRVLLLTLATGRFLESSRVAPFAFYNPTPLIEAIFVDVMGMFLFTVLFLCYRTHLSPLYSGEVGYIQSTSQNNSRDRQANAPGNTDIELQAPKRISVATEDGETTAGGAAGRK